MCHFSTVYAYRGVWKFAIYLYRLYGNVLNDITNLWHKTRSFFGIEQPPHNTQNKQKKNQNNKKDTKKQNTKQYTPSQSNKLAFTRSIMLY